MMKKMAILLVFAGFVAISCGPDSDSNSAQYGKVPVRLIFPWSSENKTADDVQSNVRYAGDTNCPPCDTIDFVFNGDGMAATTYNNIDYSLHSYTCKGVPAGDNRTLTVNVKDSSDNVLYTGSATGIKVPAGGTADTVSVTLNPVDVADWYVNDNATGAGTGLSWNDAFTKIQDAVNAASNGDVIWVAEGIYKVSGTGAVLIMKDGVKLYGGFVGNETIFYQRGNPSDHLTILDGQNQSVHVVIGASYSRLDGFKIMRGKVVGGSATGESKGAGMYNVGTTNLIVANCIFTDNGSLIRNSCVFPSGCDTAKSGGAGIYNEGQIEIKNCLFYNNSVTCWAYACGIPAQTCSCYGYGGAIFSGSGSAMSIINCTFAGNSSQGSGGALYTLGTSNITVKNCVFWGNTPNQIGGSSTLTVTYSDVSGGWTGTGNKNANSLFVAGSNGNYYLSQPPAQASTSPCVDAGDDTAAALGLDTKTTRTDGVPDSGTVDMGFHY